jgi:hypothetical protein
MIFEQIESLVSEGKSAKEIADKIGCKLGTLRVKCSQHRISLRRTIDAKGSSGNCPRKLVISIDEETSLDLALRAAKHGMSCAKLAAALLETIAQDNLYNAVIDKDSGR